MTLSSDGLMLPECSIHESDIHGEGSSKASPGVPGGLGDTSPGTHDSIARFASCETTYLRIEHNHTNAKKVRAKRARGSECYSRKEDSDQGNSVDGNITKTRI